MSGGVMVNAKVTAGKLSAARLAAVSLLWITVPGPPALLEAPVASIAPPVSANPSLSRSRLVRAKVPRFAPDRILVRFRPGTAASEIGKMHRQVGGRKLDQIPDIAVEVVKVPAARWKKALPAIRPIPTSNLPNPIFTGY